VRGSAVRKAFPRRSALQVATYTATTIHGCTNRLCLAPSRQVPASLAPSRQVPASLAASYGRPAPGATAVAGRPRP
jgi:hypothetical protein